MRREKISMLILTVTCMLAGCGGEKTPEVSSLSIDKEGKVSHQIVGQFEQEYYEKDGLMSLAQERVAEYCADNGEGSVVLGEVDEQDGKVLIHLIMRPVRITALLTGGSCFWERWRKRRDRAITWIMSPLPRPRDSRWRSAISRNRRRCR